MATISARPECPGQESLPLRPVGSTIESSSYRFNVNSLKSRQAHKNSPQKETHGEAFQDSWFRVALAQVVAQQRWPGKPTQVPNATDETDRDGRRRFSEQQRW